MRNSAWSQKRENSLPVSDSDCAISFSWWGKIRSTPPAWISRVSPRYLMEQYPPAQQNYNSNQQQYPPTQQNYNSNQRQYPPPQQNYDPNQQQYPPPQQNYEPNQPQRYNR